MAVNTQSNLDLTTTSDQVTISYDYDPPFIFKDRSTNNGTGVIETPTITSDSTQSGSVGTLLGGGSGNWENHTTYWVGNHKINSGTGENSTLTITYSQPVTLNTFKICFKRETQQAWDGTWHKGGNLTFTISYGDTVASINNVLPTFSIPLNERENNTVRSSDNITDTFLSYTFNKITTNVLKIDFDDGDGAWNYTPQLSALIFGFTVLPNHYKLEKSTDNVTYTLLTDTYTTKSYTDTGLDLNTLYFYRLRATFNPLTIDIAVKTQTKTSSHPAHENGSETGYLLNYFLQGDDIEAESPNLTLFRGGTYKFDQSDSTNSGHPLLFYEDEGKATQYSTGVTTAGTPGQSGAYTQIIVASDAPNEIWYQCVTHPNMGWKFTISDREFGNTTEKGIATSPSPPSNLEVTNVGDGQSIDISWNKGGGSTSLIKSNLDGGAFNNLQVDYANNTFKNESLDKTKVYKYRVFSTGNVEYSIIPKLSNPAIDLAVEDNLTSNNKIAQDWDWYENNKTFYNYSKDTQDTNIDPQPTAYSMDDYIYVNTSKAIYRKNIVTGATSMKNWTNGGTTEGKEGFRVPYRNVHIWKDNGTGKTWLLKYLGVSSSSGTNSGSNIIKAICISDLFDGVAISSCLKYIKCPYGPSRTALSGGHQEYYATAFSQDENALFTIPQETAINIWHKFVIPTQPSSGDWNATVTSKNSNAFNWNTAPQDQHYQNGYAAYVKNTDWPNGVVIAWGFKGKYNNHDYYQSNNPLRGKILYWDQNDNQIYSGSCDAWSWVEFYSGTDSVKRRWTGHPNAKVDDSNRYAFYYSRGYRQKNQTLANSYAIQKAAGKAGLSFFKIGTPSSLNVTCAPILYSKLLGGARAGQEANQIDDDTWFNNFKQSNPRGFQGTRTDWVNGFAKYLTPDNGVFWYLQQSLLSYVSIGFDTFTLKGNYIYGECSSFSSPFHNEIYKVSFLGNKRIEWPDIQSVTSYDVTYQSFINQPYGNLQAGVTNNYYDHNDADLPGDEFVGAGVSKVLIKYQLSIQTDYVESTAIQPYNVIPQNVTPTPTTNQVVIGWDNITAITLSNPLYKIERSEDATTYTELSNNTSTNSYTDTGLNPGSLYIYKVYLSEDSGSTFREASTPKPIVTKIQQPTLTATLNDTTISLAWDGSGNNFDIQRKEGSGSFTDLTGAQDLTVKQYDNTGLTYGTEYQYKVRGDQVDISFNAEHFYQKTDNLTKYFTETGTQTFDVNNSHGAGGVVVPWRNKVLSIGPTAIDVYEASGGNKIGTISHNADFNRQAGENQHTYATFSDVGKQIWFTHNDYVYTFGQLTPDINYVTNTSPNSNFWRLNIENPFSGTKEWEQITPSGSSDYNANNNNHPDNQTNQGYNNMASHKIDNYVWIWGRSRTGSSDNIPANSVRYFWYKVHHVIYDIENNAWLPKNLSNADAASGACHLGRIGGRPAIIKDENGNYDKVYWLGAQHRSQGLSSLGSGYVGNVRVSSSDTSYPPVDTWFYRFDISDKSKPDLTGTFSWAPPTNGVAGGSNSAGTCNYDIVFINSSQAPGTAGTGTKEDGDTSLSKNDFKQSNGHVVYENRWVIWLSNGYENNSKKINVLDTSGNLAGNLYRLPTTNFGPVNMGDKSQLIECNGFLWWTSSNGRAIIKIADIINTAIWNEVPDKTTYTIESSLDDFATTTTEATGHAASPYNVVQLPSTGLKFKVSTTVNKASDYSTPTATIKPYNPVPQNVTLTATENQIIVGWDSESNTHLYKIERSEDATTYTELINNTSTNSYTDTGLNPGSLYIYKVYLSGDNGATFGRASTPKAIVTKIQKPTLTATLNDTTISLTWDSSGNNFDIQRKVGSGSFTDLTGAQDLTVKQYDNTGLTYDTEYQYKVRGDQVDVSFNVEHFYQEFNWPIDFIENNITPLEYNLRIVPFRGGDANDADGMHDSTEWAASILLSDSSNIYLMNGHARSNFTRPQPPGNGSPDFSGPNRNKIRKYEVSTSSLGKKLDDSNYYQDIDVNSGAFARERGNNLNFHGQPDACMCIYNNHLYVYGGGDHKKVYSQPNNNYSSEQVTECALLKKGGSAHGHGRRGGYLNETKWIKDGYQGGFSTTDSNTWFKQTRMRKINLTTGVVTNIFTSNWASQGPGYFQAFWMGEGDIGGSKGGPSWDTRQNSTPYHKNAAFCVADQYLFVLGGYVNSWDSAASNYNTLCGPARYILPPYTSLPDHPAVGTSHSGTLSTLSIFNLDQEGWIGTGTTYVSGAGVVNFGNSYAQAIKNGNNGYKIIVGGPDKDGFYEFDWNGATSIHDQNIMFTPISTSVQSINTYPNGRNTYVDINFSMGLLANAKYNYSSSLYKNRWIIYVQQTSDESGIAIMDTSGSSMGKLYKLPLLAENTGNNGWWGVSGQDISIGKQFKGDYITMTLLNDTMYFFKPENNSGSVSGNSQTNYNNTIGQVDLKEVINKILWNEVPDKTTYTIESSLDDFATTTTEATGHAASPYDVVQLPSTGVKFRVSTRVNKPSDYSTAVSITPSDGRVQNVVFTNPSTNSVGISFDTTENSTGYKIERKRVDVTETYTIKSTINDKNTTTYSDTGLSPGALYFYRLRSRKNSSVDNPQRAKRAFVSKFTKPAFTSTSIGNKKTILNWGGVGADKYILKRSSDGGNTYSDIATNITGTTYTDSGLTNNSNYKYKLVASEKTFEIPATYDSNTTKATWNVEDLTILGKFTLIKKETNENSFSVIKENISESATETTVDAAHQSATAEYKIRFTVSLDSDESNQTADITPKHPASGNTDFGADGISKIDANLTSLVLEFSNNIQSGRANSNEIDKDDFEIIKQDSVGNSSTITIDSYSMSGNKITFLYPSNTDMTSFAGDTFTVRYTKKSNDEDYHLYDNVNNRFLNSSSSIKSVTNIIPPKKVIWAASDSVKAGNRQTKLSWASVAGTSYYKVQVKKDSGNYQESTERIPGDKTSFTIRNLKNNSNYKFKIKAYKINASGDIEGEVSDESILSEVKALVGFTDLKVGLSAAKQTNLDDKIASLSVSTPGSVKKEFEDNKATLITDQNVKFADVPRVREAFKSILTSFDDITDVVEKKRKKRQARAEAIQMIFDLDEGILTFEAGAEDLDIEVFDGRPNKYKVTLPKGKEINVTTLDVGAFVVTPEYKLTGYYIPLQDQEGAVLKFGDSSILVEKIIDGNDEKTHISIMDGTIVVNEVISANTDFLISDSTKNYLFPDDKITLNNVDFVIGSVTILAEVQPDTFKPQQPGRKQHKPLASGFFEHPGSVVNNLFMSGNFGSGLSNRKLTTLNKNQTKYKDYRLGTNPSEGKPHKNWSQPVRPNTGSGGRLVRLKANAIKKSN